MATPLDIGLLQHFDTVFPFIFVLVIVYAVLSNIMFKDKQAIAFILAFLLAVMTLFSNIAVKTISRMAPWVVLLMVFGILVLIAYQSFGVSNEKIMDVLTKGEYRTTFAWWIFALLLIIGLGTLSSVVSEEQSFAALAEGGNASTTKIAGEGEQVGFWATLFHPKVLGLVLILLIAMFTIQKLAAKD
jgi:hypothetical protein